MDRLRFRMATAVVAASLVAGASTRAARTPGIAPAEYAARRAALTKAI
jgi:hypothetical protein